MSFFNRWPASRRSDVPTPRTAVRDVFADTKRVVTIAQELAKVATSLPEEEQQKVLTLANELIKTGESIGEKQGVLVTSLARASAT